MNDKMEQFQGIYFEECSDLLESCESYLVKLESGDYSNEDINAIFRCVHTIKGGAGTFGFSRLVDFAHTFETLLDKLREGSVEIDKDLVKILLKGNDIICDLVAFHKGDGDVSQSIVEDVQKKMASFLGLELTQNKSNEKDSSQQESEVKKYKILFTPKPDMMRFGNEPLYIIRALKDISSSNEDIPDKFKSEDTFLINCKNDKVPLLDEISIQDSYFYWEIYLITSSCIDDIQEVFEFVEDDCDLKIEVVSDNNSEKQKDNGIDNESLKTEKNKKNISTGKSLDTSKSIRVELGRIDKLVNTVGEMVIKQAMVIDQATMVYESDEKEMEKKREGLSKSLQELSQYTRELQESVMSIRAQPIKTVFSRFSRLVRDLSDELGKEIVLETQGEATEIDKTVIERLGEPLTHMIRNSIDHGIETSEERVKAGKPSHGTIFLTAGHRSGRIVIEIKDDGKGINRSKVLEKAIKNGIIAKDEKISNEEIDQLIFHAGFSTATEVTNVSGRGVGMDVVKSSIQNLGGRVSIKSEEGKGCNFSLTLPLTLAVMDGMIVSCGKELFVIPLIHIMETIKPKEGAIQKLVGNSDLIHIRRETISLIYLKDSFCIKDGYDREKGIVLVLETEGGEKYGLMVDEILGQQQVVLKSLEENYEPIEGVSAATILGNGRVALILDISVLKSMAKPLSPIKSTVKEIQLHA